MCKFPFGWSRAAVNLWLWMFDMSPVHSSCALIMSVTEFLHTAFFSASALPLSHVSAPLLHSSKQSTSREVGHHNHHQQQQQGGQGFLPLPASTPVPDFTTEPIDPNEPTYCLCSQVGAMSVCVCVCVCVWAGSGLGWWLWCKSRKWVWVVIIVQEQEVGCGGDYCARTGSGLWWWLLCKSTIVFN